MQEEWRPVPGFPMYEVSNYGRVVSHYRPTPCQIKPSPGHRGHLGMVLYRDKKPTHRRVHALVAEAFIGPRPAGMEVRHLDGDSANNVLSNLAYGTSSQNNLDAVAHGTHVNARKTHCKRGHEFTEANTRIEGRGVRACRACGRARSLAAYYRSRAA